MFSKGKPRTPGQYSVSEKGAAGTGTEAYWTGTVWIRVDNGCGQLHNQDVQYGPSTAEGKPLPKEKPATKRAN